MAVPSQKINDRFDRVAMTERAPVLALLGMRRNHVVPQSVRVVVGAKSRIDDVNVFVLAQLLFDFRPLE